MDFSRRKMASVCFVHVLCYVLIWILLVENSEGLTCYQCVDSGGEDTDCQNAGRLLNYTKGPVNGEEWKKNRYFKNCTNEKVNQTMCMLETHSVGGQIKSYHRDCSDGKTFSFTGTALKLSRLENIIPNNETTCSYYAISNIHVCLTLCEGDMCNGPMVPEEPEVVCKNVTDDFTGEISVVCSASSLTHFLMYGSLNLSFLGLHGLSVLLPFLILTFLVVLVM